LYDNCQVNCLHAASKMDFENFPSSTIPLMFKSSKAIRSYLLTKRLETWWQKFLLASASH
jgi:hypothetical protein